MQPDLILVGGGLANGLLAYRLRQTRPDLSLLILERGALIGGDHTWSFHSTDLSEAQNAWLDPFVVYRWPGYEVRFPGLTRRLDLGYRAVTAERFRAVLTGALGPALRTGVDVTEVGARHVTLAGGETIKAGAVVDGRGFTPSTHQVDRFQSFFGVEVRLEHPHGLRAPILMDATVDQIGAYRFIYVLPFAADVLLVEDTYYTDQSTLDIEALRLRVAAYAEAQGWRIAEILREESGVLPITLSGRMDEAAMNPIAAVGMRASLYHPTTGYSLPDAVRLADLIAALPILSSDALSALTWSYARGQWRRRGLFRLLNRLLFLAGPATERYKVMRRFYGMPERLIARFYAGNLLPQDKFRLLVGRPPVPFTGALRAIMATGR